MAKRTERRDLRAEMERETGEYPESWIPKVGDILAGELIRYDRGTTQYGGAIIVVIHDSAVDELRGFWLIHHVAREEFKKLRPRPGERVAIKRLPDAEKGYRRYRVIVDREEPELPDFDAFGASSDRTGHPDVRGDWQLRELPPEADADAPIDPNEPGF